MKLSVALLSSLLCAASASAQYFSAGWTPGQPVADEPAPAPGYNFDPQPPPTPGPTSAHATVPNPNLGIFDRILTSGPVSSLLGRFGVNISEAVARSGALPWDPRIPLITDENYEDVIVHENLTAQEEKDRVWMLIVSVTASQNNAISKIVDESFDEAYNQTMIAGDLPHVRWGRIDYMSVTYLTTKWSIWSGPFLVVLTDRGQTLRFYKADRVRIAPDLIRELLVEEIWRNTAPWKTNFAPGGKREFLIDYYARALTKIYNVVNRVPRFVLMILSGAVASFVMRLLHKNPETSAPQAQEKPIAPGKAESEISTVVASSNSATSTATASPSKSKSKRKTGKK